MERHAILERLRENEAMLRDLGITHAALFGSRARGDHRPDSDTDILIELDQVSTMDVFDYLRITDIVAGLFEGRVDVVEKAALKSGLIKPVSRDAVYAF